MKPQIDKTAFGSIHISGDKYTHDVLIRLDGTVKKRKKKLSKEVFGTSHRISLPEAEYIFEEGAQELIIGTGMFDRVQLSEEAAEYFSQKGLKTVLKATPKAAESWNKAQGKVIALFHTTC